MNRRELRLVQLEAAAQQADNREEAKRILAEQQAMEAAATPSQLDAVAHDLIHVAVNPDRLRALLRHLEQEKPGSIAFLERTLTQLARNL